MSGPGGIMSDLSEIQEMNAERRDHEERLASSHCRGEAEDRHNERMRLMREIDADFDKYIRPHIKRYSKFTRKQRNASTGSDK